MLAPLPTLSEAEELDAPSDSYMRSKRTSTNALVITSFEKNILFMLVERLSFYCFSGCKDVNCE